MYTTVLFQGDLREFTFNQQAREVKFYGGMHPDKLGLGITFEDEDNTIANMDGTILAPHVNPNIFHRGFAPDVITIYRGLELLNSIKGSKVQPQTLLSMGYDAAFQYYDSKDALAVESFHRLLGDNLSTVMERSIPTDQIEAAIEYITLNSSIQIFSEPVIREIRAGRLESTPVLEKLIASHAIAESSKTYGIIDRIRP